MPEPPNPHSSPIRTFTERQYIASDGVCWPLPVFSNWEYQLFMSATIGLGSEGELIESAQPRTNRWFVIALSAPPPTPLKGALPPQFASTFLALSRIPESALTLRISCKGASHAFYFFYFGQAHRRRQTTDFIFLFQNKRVNVNSFLNAANEG